MYKVTEHTKHSRGSTCIGQVD